MTLLRSVLRVRSVSGHFMSLNFLANSYVEVGTGRPTCQARVPRATTYRAKTGQNARVVPGSCQVVKSKAHARPSPRVVPSCLIQILNIMKF